MRIKLKKVFLKIDDYSKKENFVTPRRLERNPPLQCNLCFNGGWVKPVWDFLGTVFQVNIIG